MKLLSFEGSRARCRTLPSVLITFEGHDDTRDDEQHERKECEDEIENVLEPGQRVQEFESGLRSGLSFIFRLLRHL